MENSKMLQLLRKNQCFFVPYLIFLIAAGAALLIFSKIDIHIFLNGLHFPIGDIMFKYGTNIGDGIVIAILIFVLLFIRYRYALILGLGTIAVTIIVQIFKYFILPEADRPKLYFEKVAESVDLYFVPGVNVHLFDSFPSGHTATGFSMFLFLALISKNSFIKFLCFLLALFIGYSRVYLSHHFLIDIYFGSLIAVFLIALFYVWGSNWKSNKLDLSLLHTLKIKK